LYSLSDLHAKMTEFANGDEVYSVYYFKQRLKEYYGDHVFFSEKKGLNNVVCLRDMAYSIISDKWHAEKKENVGEESVRIVQTAAKLIKSQMKGLDLSTDNYPVISGLVTM